VVIMNVRAARGLSQIVATENKRRQMTNDPSFLMLIAVLAAGAMFVSFMVAGVDLFSIDDPGYFFED